MAEIEKNIITAPDGMLYKSLTSDLINSLFINNKLSNWLEGNGYVIAELNRGTDLHRYLAIGFVNPDRFYINAVFDRHLPRSRLMIPITKLVSPEQPQVWDGQTFMKVLPNNLVTCDQAIEILSVFWNTGSLSNIVDWIEE